MEALAKVLRDKLSRLTLTPGSKEHEAAYGRPRAMTGLTLSTDKQRKAAAFKGSINHGDPTLAKR